MIDWRGTLRRFNIAPRKRLGQNFLFDPAVLERIAASGEVGPDDPVLEIGPGAGSLTRHLAARARHVVAVEVDARLLPLLQHTLGDLPNVTVVHGDILQLDVPSLIRSAAAGASSYKVVANIPYYLTSAILRHLLEGGGRPRPSRIVLTVQREVAERICADPPRMSLLAVSVQFYGQPQVVARVPAAAFFPVPEVDSAIVRIDLFDRPPLEQAAAEADRFFALVKAGFSQKRKQLKNSLAGGLGRRGAEVEDALRRADIEPARRAQTLTLAEWGRLFGAWRAMGEGEPG